VPYEHFASKCVVANAYILFLTALYRWIPLYSGLQVTIRIMPTNRSYTLSKDLLCTQSAYFKAAFEGNFQEAQNQTLSLTEMDDVVSIQGFEMLIQWPYIGQICFEPPILIRSIVEKQKAITSIVEFHRIADMCGVTGMEFDMAYQISCIITSILPDDLTNGALGDEMNPLVTPHHTRAARLLPNHHPVRELVVNEAIEEYIRSDGQAARIRPDLGLQSTISQVQDNLHL
jgi:hypothetical protein